jgi:hypothetical protein
MTNLLMYATAVLFAFVVTKPTERMMQKYKDTKDFYKKEWSK